MSKIFNLKRVQLRIAEIFNKVKDDPKKLQQFQNIIRSLEVLTKEDNVKGS